MKFPLRTKDQIRDKPFGKADNIMEVIWGKDAV